MAAAWRAASSRLPDGAGIRQRGDASKTPFAGMKKRL